MSALAQEKVGQYLNRHFVSAFQKVATFRIAGGQKQGGNVASYFCTPEGHVLHAVAGPVTGDTLLREASWVVETYNLAMLERHQNLVHLKAFFKKAHLDRLRQEHGFQVHNCRVPAVVTPAMLASFLEQHKNRGLGNQGKVHLLLAAVPLPGIDQVYRAVFEKILNEKISTNPVGVPADQNTSGLRRLRLDARLSQQSGDTITVQIEPIDFSTGGNGQSVPSWKNLPPGEYETSPGKFLLIRSQDEKEKWGADALARGVRVEKYGNYVHAKACYYNALAMYPNTTTATQARAALDRLETEEARETLLALGRKRFGQPAEGTVAAVRAISDYDHLQFLIHRLPQVSLWGDLLTPPTVAEHLQRVAR